MSTREHGTRTCYVHGPDGIADGSGCRCEPCRKANAAAVAKRKQAATPPYIDATPVREHVRALTRAGVGLKTISARAGISHGALSKLMYGERTRGMAPSKRVRPETAAKLLAVTTRDAADRAHIDGTATLRNVEELRRRGWTKSEIARRIGQTSGGLQLGKSGMVTAKHARTIAGLLDEPVPMRRAGRHLIAPTWNPEAERAEQMRKAAQAERRQSYRLIERGDIEDAPSLDPGPGDLLARGECRRRDDVPTWLFFPSPDDHRTIEKARQVCESCPVAAECRQWAIDHDEQGIWGGTTEAERARLVEVAS